MSDKKTGTDIDFDQLTPQQQEAYIPRGEYKNPELLDQGNAPKGAPTGPVAEKDDSVGDPDLAPDEGEKKPKPKRST